MSKGAGPLTGSITVRYSPDIIDYAKQTGLVANEHAKPLRTFQSTISVHHSGPLPHPQYLAHYNTTIPNGADRIMQMAEKQQAHEINTEKEALTQNFRYQNMGQIFGAALFLILLIFAFVIALKTQNPWLTGLFLRATVIEAVGLFVNGRNEDDA